MPKDLGMKSMPLTPDAHLKALRNFRAISALEGLSTPPECKVLMEQLVCGKIKPKDYVAAKTCLYKKI